MPKIVTVVAEISLRKLLPAPQWLNETNLMFHLSLTVRGWNSEKKNVLGGF